MSYFSVKDVGVGNYLIGPGGARPYQTHYIASGTTGGGFAVSGQSMNPWTAIKPAGTVSPAPAQPVPQPEPIPIPTPTYTPPPTTITYTPPPPTSISTPAYITIPGGGGGGAPPPPPAEDPLVPVVLEEEKKPGEFPWWVLIPLALMAT